MSSTTSPPQGELSTADRPSPGPRREKPQLSCSQCRRRKSRCDRRVPCSNCASRGQICTYASQAGFRDNNHSSTALPTDSSWQDRLNQLESLVVSLRSELTAGKTGNTDAAGLSTALINTDHDVSVDKSSECGSMVISPAEHRYVGREHWVAILDSIAELRGRVIADDIRRNCEDVQVTDQFPRALLLYGYRAPTSRIEILESLPAKPIVDRYVSRYFNNLDLVSFTLHGPSFLQEYEAFWENPDLVPFIWIGLLFSIICLAVIVSDHPDSHHGNTEDDQRSHQIALFREKIVQCFVLGEYTRPGPYVLEAMIHYVYVEFLLCRDAREDLWFLLAFQVNMALRMGYHRDPSHFPNISPFQSEMRRRLWSSINFSDVMISCQMGMPRMLSNAGCDTAEPRNLNDSDLTPGMSELPVARPETEITTVLSVIARRRVLVALGIIADLSASAKPYSYAEVMRVNQVLQEAQARIPPPMKTKPLASSMTDPPIIIMARLFTRHMFYKGQLMLHRRFLQVNASQSADALAYSRDTCLDASLQSLRIQKILDEETRPGGQLDTMRWRMTSIMNDQFLIATMVLCSMILHGKHAQSRLEEILASLRGARNIWMRTLDSQEATKAVETINLTLAKASKDARNAAGDEEDGSVPFEVGNGANDGNIDTSRLLLQELDMTVYQSEGPVVQSLPWAGQQDQPQGQNFAFNMNMWTNDATTLNSWINMNGHMSLDSQQP
ncbi:fungal-specific transcription factor domain-containing protein [Xylaria arbuscula]|nr:fungal-specific transcription factor domain-containing protein [Xylaria arbuscula]